tara:strand:- start:279 stop:677 length:399 start_codon:yes stop_codon:yes gene_type:complete
MNKYNLKDKKKNKKNIEKFNLSERRSIFATSIVWLILTFLMLVLMVYLRPKNEERVELYNNIFKDSVTYDSAKNIKSSFYFGDKDDTVIREYAYFNLAISLFVIANTLLFFSNLLKIFKPMQRNPKTGNMGV